MSIYDPEARALQVIEAAIMAGRDELVAAGYVYHREGWAYLSHAGVAAALQHDAKPRRDQRWYRKQNNLPERD